MYLKIQHSAGFFSCCSVFLHTLVEFFNTHHTLPLYVDSSETFIWYKPHDQQHVDVTNDYFNRYDQGDSNFLFSWEKHVDYKHTHQYENYKTLDFGSLHKFVFKYFSPSTLILTYIRALEEKYIDNKYDYENICVLFYRGNDKATETTLCGYDQFIEKGKEILAQNPNVTFLIQSDESEFIEIMTAVFPNSFYFKDEIRHMRKNISTVDHVFAHLNNHYSKYYLAITIIMSKCKYIVCTTGNCSIWIILFRSHANNVMQFLNDRWV
jgi:hypothetical protein